MNGSELFHFPSLHRNLSGPLSACLALLISTDWRCLACCCAAGRRQVQAPSERGGGENRLVADELERRWNDALLRVEEVESRIEQQTRTSGQTPPAQPDEFADLAAALESISPQADAD